MPSTTVRARRSLNAGSKRRGDPRQQTLTQIEFVTRLTSPTSPEGHLEYEEDVSTARSPELELDHEHEDLQRPRKRRRRDVRASLSPPPQESREGYVGVLVPTKSHSSPGLVNTRGRRSSTPESSLQNPLHPPTEVPAISTATTQAAADRALMPPPDLPRTPARPKRTYVPSSQSPETTPLSTRSATTTKGAQQSPLRGRVAKPMTGNIRRTNGSAKPPNPFRRFAVADTYSSELDEEEQAGKESEREQDYTVRKLELVSPTTPTGPTVARPGRLEASPDVPNDAYEVIYVESSSQVEPEEEHNQAQQSMPHQFSRPGLAADSIPETSRQHLKELDPEEISNPVPPVVQTSSDLGESNASKNREHRDKNHRPRVTFSQATTQIPTQFPAHDLTSAPTDTGLEAEPELPAVLRVTSSQATTAAPSSSDSASDHGGRSEHQYAGSPVTTSRASRYVSSKQTQDAMPTTSQVVAGWEWDGKDWTESQLLPASLMNFPLPDFTPASQQSMAYMEEDLVDEDEPSSKSHATIHDHDHEYSRNTAYAPAAARTSNDDVEVAVRSNVPDAWPGRRDLDGRTKPTHGRTRQTRQTPRKEIKNEFDT